MDADLLPHASRLCHVERDCGLLSLRLLTYAVSIAVRLGFGPLDFLTFVCLVHKDCGPIRKSQN
jgi:hypothetical protein